MRGVGAGEPLPSRRARRVRWNVDGPLMLFNSEAFLFLFLPVTWLGFCALARAVPALAVPWLLAASLVFYAAWNAAYLPVLIGSVAFNFAIGRLLTARSG